MPKQEFVPGKPGQPRAGATHHQLLRDPDFVSKLQPVIAKWEAANPGRVLKGPAVKGMLHHIGVDISGSAAGKMAAKIEGAKQKIQEQRLMQLMGAAAKKAGPG